VPLPLPRTALLTIVLGLALATPAQAHVTADDPLLDLMRGTAIAYWTAQGVAACPAGVTAEIGPIDGFATGSAATGSCHFRLRDTTTTTALAVVGTRARGIRLYWRRERIRTLCLTVYHETGHALGLDHDYGGIMAQAFYGDVPIPADCYRYARAAVEYASRVKRSHQAHGSGLAPGRGTAGAPGA